MSLYEYEYYEYECPLLCFLAANPAGPSLGLQVPSQ